MEITIDVTGMYYSNTVTVAEGSTVFDVMQAASVQRAPGNGGILTFGLELASDGVTPSGFLNQIKIVYDEESDPRSRQLVTAGQPGAPRPKGVYLYNDDMSRDPFLVDGGVSFRLAWQYYISDAEGRSRNANVDGTRKIVPFLRSNEGEGSVELHNGDRIVWRAVAIFGIDEAIEAAGKGISEEYGISSTMVDALTSGSIKSTIRDLNVIQNRN